jgi:hypothetical protein
LLRPELHAAGRFAFRQAFALFLALFALFSALLSACFALARFPSLSQ